MPQCPQTYQRSELPLCSSCSTLSVRPQFGQGGVTGGTAMRIDEDSAELRRGR
jgi:hypothetical protein